MRDIRFRAWDVENGYMITSKQGVFTALRNVMDITRQDDGYYNNGELLKPNKNKYELMQFTGLYDKNKVPIYEGDILKFINNRSEDEDVSTSKVYTFEGVPFCIDIETGEYDVQTLAWAIKGDISECEVIGNIYDNPDLLGE